MDELDRQMIQALERAIKAITDGRCKRVPRKMKRKIAKTADNFTDFFTGDELLPLGEVCSELDCGLTSLHNKVKDGDLPPPEDLHQGCRKGIRQRDLDEYKDKRG